MPGRAVAPLNSSEIVIMGGGVSLGFEGRIDVFDTKNNQNQCIGGRLRGEDKFPCFKTFENQFAKVGENVVLGLGDFSTGMMTNFARDFRLLVEYDHETR